MRRLDPVEAKRVALDSPCRKYAAERLRLFGSAVQGGFDPLSSDLDFLVEFNPASGMNAFHRFIDLSSTWRISSAATSTSSRGGR